MGHMRMSRLFYSSNTCCICACCVPPKVIAPEYREVCLTRASNYVEVTRLKDGSINIENQ